MLNDNGLRCTRVPLRDSKANLKNAIMNTRSGMFWRELPQKEHWMKECLESLRCKPATRSVCGRHHRMRPSETFCGRSCAEWRQVLIGRHCVPTTPSPPIAAICGKSEYSCYRFIQTLSFLLLTPLSSSKLRILFCVSRKRFLCSNVPGGYCSRSWPWLHRYSTSVEILSLLGSQTNIRELAAESTGCGLHSKIFLKHNEPRGDQLVMAAGHVPTLNKEMLTLFNVSRSMPRSMRGLDGSAPIQTLHICGKMARFSSIFAIASRTNTPGFTSNCNSRNAQTRLGFDSWNNHIPTVWTSAALRWKNKTNLFFE